ncbi:MAG: ribosomal L7Ae/L30e/S12e/Gadd45 family protein [Clostridia bacterium]|nr:ribosomal L7Ae/L30e/S12e/Gadd45 family protein [Clostridia bacterium]
MTRDEQNFARYLGLCRRAGGVIRGGETILRAVRSDSTAKKPMLVLIASDASDRTAKQLADKCRFYQVPCYRCTADSFRLAEITGYTSPCAALGLLRGRGPGDALRTVCAAMWADTSPAETENIPTNDREAITEPSRLLDRKDDGEWQ